jgi:nucleoside 2-deoxyribosyltransferase
MPISFEYGAQGFLEPVFDFVPDVITCYVAGPEGFSESTSGWMNNELIPMLEAEGAFPISPWRLTQSEEVAQFKEMPLGEERLLAHRFLNKRIGWRNHRAMRQANFCVASLDGPDVDSGTTS